MVPGSRFTNGLPCMKVPVKSFYAAHGMGDRLYYLPDDPAEDTNILSDENRAAWELKLTQALMVAGAPDEEYLRLGLAYQKNQD